MSQAWGLTLIIPYAYFAIGEQWYEGESHETFKYVLIRNLLNTKGTQWLHFSMYYRTATCRPLFKPWVSLLSTYKTIELWFEFLSHFYGFRLTLPRTNSHAYRNFRTKISDCRLTTCLFFFLVVFRFETNRSKSLSAKSRDITSRTPQYDSV